MPYLPNGCNERGHKLLAKGTCICRDGLITEEWVDESIARWKYQEWVELLVGGGADDDRQVRVTAGDASVVGGAL